MNRARPVDPRDWHAQVRPLCLARLRDAWNGTTALFDRQLRAGAWAPTLGTEALTSSAIVLIGLARGGDAPEIVGADRAAALAALVPELRRHDYLGGLGLVLWAHAVNAGASTAELLAASGAADCASDRWLAALTTMECAWLLSGLVQARRRGETVAVAPLLAATRRELLARFVPTTRLFAHGGPRGALRHRLRRGIANFADQIYPVQALAFLAALDGDADARTTAAAAAARLVELQGALGQWCWHYDSGRGSVVQAYPIYSVHQHGMAPMALLELAAAGGPDCHAAAAKGRTWIEANESGRTLVDPAAGTIWRSLERAESGARRATRKVASLLHVAGPDTADADAAALRLNRETRPYEWAWCLYAGALESERAAAGAPVR